jgi:hypothetical protein
VGVATPFQFRALQVVTKYTGVAADGPRSLSKGMARVPTGSLFYHLHHALFRRHFTTAEFMNDFARWAWVTLREEALAEKLATVDPMDFTSVGDARNQLIHLLNEFVGQTEFVQRVRPSERFYFLEAQSFVYPIGVPVSGLHEMRDRLRTVGPDAIFYHFVAAPLRLGQRDNDFSIWLEKELGETQRAAQIRTLSPYKTDLPALRAEIAQLLE